MAAESESLSGDLLESQSTIEDYSVHGMANDQPILQDAIDILFHELNFFPIASQSNVYGMTSLITDNSTELLVATVSGGKVYSLRFNQHSVQSTMKVVGFSYIPALAEIISIDMFTTDNCGPIVGVTLVIKKDSDSGKDVFFNIYGHHTIPTKSPDWETIGEDWQTLILAYTPFLLTHTLLVDSNGRGSETVFLISGDDCQVHMYRIVTSEGNEEIRFHEEIPSEAYFPEFLNIPSSLTCMDIIYNNDTSTRLTAFGCQNGYIKCAQVDIATTCMLWCCDNAYLDGPLTSVRLFQNHAHKIIKDTAIETFHLLVTSAIESGCVFVDVLQSELKSTPLSLPSSDQYDSVLCSEVADISWNGLNKLILGTYGKKLLVYDIHHQGGKYNACLRYARRFAHPIHRVMYCDITGDGVNELIVLSTAGVHVLQHDLYQVTRLLDRRSTSAAHNHDND